MKHLWRVLVAFLVSVTVVVPLVLPSTSVSASAVTDTATQSFTPPSSAFAGASAGGDGWAVAIYGGNVYNVFHHQTYFGIMCHSESTAAACWTTGTSGDTGSSNVYKTITDGAIAFSTTGKPGLYVDQSTGYLYVYAVRNDSSHSQPGVVCVNLNAAATNSDPLCSGTGGQPPGWTPLTVGTTDSETVATTYGGTVTPTFYDGNLYAFNPFTGATESAGGTGSSGKNALLCYDIATQSACSGEPYQVNVGSSTATSTDSSSPPPPDTLVGGQLFIPTSWSTGNMIACVDLTMSTPENCVGTWPLDVGAAIVIPSLTSAGAVNGICAEETVWACYGLNGSVQVTPSGLTTTTLQSGAGGSPSGSSWDGAPVTVGTRVLQNDSGTNTVYCYDFATNGECSTTSGSFPKAMSNLSLLYTVNLDPQNPTCIWVNSDSGADQIQNFDAITGGTCAAAPVRIYASSFVEPYQVCTPTSFTTLSLTVSGTLQTTPAPTLSFTNGNGVVIDGPYNFDVSTPTNPTLDLTSLNYTTPLDLSTQSALPQFVLDLVPGSSESLGTVTVTVTWSGSSLTQCDPGYSGPSPNTSAASAIGDTSATLNGSVTNTGSDSVTPVDICYQTTSFTSGNCTGTSVSATAGSVTNSITPYSLSPTGLSPGTTYYYELVGTDATTGSELYGGVQSFTTGPTARTGAASGITTTEGTLNATLYNPASDTFTAKAFCYQTTVFTSGHCTGTTTTATLVSSATTNVYDLALTGLTAGQTFYYEFTATPASGSTLGGGVQSFTTAPVATTTTATPVGDSSATLTGTNYNPTSDAVTGTFCYQTTSFTSGNCTGTSVSATAGTGVNSIFPETKMVSGLAQATTYYYELMLVDASASNATTYGGVQSFSTGPVVTTNGPLTVHPTTGTLSGSLYNPAADSFSSVDFCYQSSSFTAGSCTGTTTAAVAGAVSGATTPYTLTVSGLTTGDRYYYEFVVDDSTLTQDLFGGVQSFVTGPGATTTSASSIGNSTATVNGNVFDPNSDTINAIDFCYQNTTFTTGNCAGTTTAATAGTTSGATTAYSLSITGLSAGTTYYFELVADDTTASLNLHGGVGTFTTETLTIPTSATPPPTPIPTSATPTLTSPSSGSSTGTKTPAFSGTGVTGSTITVTDPANGQTLCTTTVSTAGTWSCTSSVSLPTGSTTVAVTETTPGDSISPAVTDTFTTTATTTPPNVTASSTSTAADGTSTFSGTGVAGSTITVTNPASGQTLCTATVSTAGTWSCTSSVSLPTGSTTVAVTETTLGDTTSTIIDTSATTRSAELAVAPKPESLSHSKLPITLTCKYASCIATTKLTVARRVMRNGRQVGWRHLVLASMKVDIPAGATVTEQLLLTALGKQLIPVQTAWYFHHGANKFRMTYSVFYTSKRLANEPYYIKASRKKTP